MWYFHVNNTNDRGQSVVEPISFLVSFKTCLWSQWSFHLEIYLRIPEIAEKGEKPEGNKREEHRGQNRSRGGRGCPSPGASVSTQEWHQLGARSWSPVRNALRLHMVNSYDLGHILARSAWPNFSKNPAVSLKRPSPTLLYDHSCHLVKFLVFHS